MTGPGPANDVDPWQATAYRRALRRHQKAALDALDGARARNSHLRAWVVLPPGAGKTLVGLEMARRLARPVVIFSPNTAIQGQWVDAWREFEPATVAADTSRDLAALVTSLTYQSLANFDPDVEVDEEGREHIGRVGGGRRTGRLLDQLHENGRALVERLRAVGPLTIVLDECHHLLEVWGRLLAELFDEVPDAHVVGLTGTPPETLTRDEAALVDELFGRPVYTTSIPAVVREGHLAPFAELAWFTTPTTVESQWLDTQAERFQQLRTDLLEPGLASTDLLDWLDARFVERRVDDAGGDATDSLRTSWATLEREEPELAAAALRFHHVGLIALPEGAVVREEHRHDPSPDDWIAVLDDYVGTCLLPSDDKRDEALVAAIRAALPGVGYHLTRRGIRRGRSPVDRVLARSDAKTRGAVEIVAAEAASIGDRLRALVLCDHEAASATLPARLRGVLDAEAGSARLLLDRLVADVRTADLGPVLVTGRTVAAEAQTARRLVEFARRHRPSLDLDEVPPDAKGVVHVTGRWQSRTWVPVVTRFYEAGHTKVLVGTRGLLGEGWDARGVNALVDLSTATTSTAVVQTRGRALRVDPAWVEKVANLWSVVCVSEEHPGGTRDWERFVRKHAGYFCVTDAGEIASGVTHVDPRLSPYAPPAAADFDAENVLMLARAESRARVRDLWQVGTPYRDEIVHTIRVLPESTRALMPAGALAAPTSAPEAVPDEQGFRGPALHHTMSTRPFDQIMRRHAPGVGVLALATGAGAALAGWWAVITGGFALLAALAAAAAEFRTRWHAEIEAGQTLVRLAAGPDPAAFAHAVADALHATGLSLGGAAAVRCVVESDGAYRFALEGCGRESSERFATALDEVLSPLWAPRYVVPRYLVAPPAEADDLRHLGRAVLAGVAAPNAVIYHAVPTILGVNRNRTAAFVTAWNTWVSGGAPVRAATPEGEGIVVTHRGADPFAATTALRLAWT